MEWNWIAFHGLDINGNVPLWPGLWNWNVPLWPGQRPPGDTNTLWNGTEL